MTRAPANLLAVRSLLLTYLDVDPNTERDQDLEPGEVGIVGDPSHRGGYHCGSDRVVANDYSVVESIRDSSGLTLDAAGLDVGMFEIRVDGVTHNLYTFSSWCVAQCVADAADTRDIRSIIYSPDGRTVKRWDRLGRRTTGDDTHLWHTHFSFFRDSIKAGRDQTPLFRRYLTSIGLLEEDMPTADEIAQAVWARLYNDYVVNAAGSRPPISTVHALFSARADANAALAQVTALRAEVAALAGKDMVDEQAIVAGILATLTPQAIAAALPPTVAKQVADELARRLVA
ncbi:hypothetical protein MRQ36_03380 [Micromonospora sp. R77]|uniref:hypothetical protein n=1 Tax=Micromonospora sp. R77 TaxID=2925836 RepID=UPI001F616F2C|nr:hypothetical protein [Micromonospora sp. R77]MCI4061668.1 hypothetical protein [Micromonospora sp. R77]